MYRQFSSAVCFALITAFAAGSAQQPSDLVRQTNRSGPRVGMTYLGGSIRQLLKVDHDLNVGSVITQFGWQVEHQLAGLEGGPVALSDVIVLVGGLDQGTAIPSLTWLCGVRLPNNVEFAVGPNLTPASVALALAVGKTFRAGALAVPMNIAVVPGRVGTRVSFMTGFNVYR
jgi:hypothetical protein